jgi:hypothetical protein
MVTRLLSAARFSVIALGLAGLFAVSGSALASTSGHVSSRPSTSTPYCVVTFINHHTLSAEKCFSTRAMMTRSIPRTDTVLSEDFSDDKYQGSVLTWTSPGLVSCSGFPNFLAPSMPSGWNDIVTSYKDFVNCGNNPHYENNNYTGASIQCGPNCSNIGGAMNDRTSSEKWGS